MADSKLTALSALSAASTDDIMYIVDDPGGTPASKKITFDNVQGSLTKVGKVSVTQPATSSTLVIADGKTLTSSNTLTLAGTDSTTITFQGTDTYVGRATTDTLTNKTLTSPTLTTPQIVNGGSINDDSGNEYLKFAKTASAVNEVTITNTATGTSPLISATGGDTNLDLRLSGKGSGKIYHSTGAYQSIQSTGDGATVTFDMSASNINSVTLGGNRTLALSNVSVGQCFMLRLTQDGTGSRTVTWFTTIKWAGGVAPTLTTTASKADLFGFLCTSSGNYDGFVIGQNI